MWVKSPDQVIRTWQQALDNANSLSLCGFVDWRLPNINELESVVNLGEPNVAAWLNTQGFSNLWDGAGSVYWSSTTYADNTDFAWRVGLVTGNVGADGWYKTQSWYAWPVRSLSSRVSVGATTRVSVDNTGNQGNGGSYTSSISGDGRYVAFESGASNLVMGDTNAVGDVFVKDRQTGQITRVSVDDSGNQGNAVSGNPSISADGRFVAFQSFASNLVAGDTNGRYDVFVYDMQTGQIGRVSVDNTGIQGNAGSSDPTISADGRYVAFVSSATNLIPGDTNVAGVVVHDRSTGQNTRVSVDSAGNPSSGSKPSINANGRFVAFESSLANLVPGDNNSASDIFVHDRDVSGSGVFDTPGNIQTTRVSVDNNGVQGNADSMAPAISADGRYVAFDSRATNLVAGDTNNREDTFVHDRQTGQTTRVSVDSAGNQGNSVSYWPVSISADGRYVAFGSDASNLVAGDTNNVWDIFVRDRQAGQTIRASVSSSGTEGNNNSYGPSLSADGKVVAFESDATTLETGDSNSNSDIFVRQLP
jgi:Tol biopolymer transport system component